MSSPEEVHAERMRRLKVEQDADLDPEAIAAVLRAKPEHVSILVTGRGAHPAVIDAADTVTEMRMVKHAYQAGIRARKGVEF